MIDARAWGVWALGILVMASTCRNPLYALLVFLVISIVDATVRGDQDKGVPSPLRFAALAIPLSAVLTALVSRVGETVLLRAPGGPAFLRRGITLEALVYGATNGLLLSLIFGGFSLFGRAVPAREMIRLVPRAFSEGGVVMSIALTFLPQTSRSVRRIRDAQAVRGHRVKGIRDWLPIFVPLLVSGLERSMNLAEAMVSRGYGAVSAKSSRPAMGAILSIGLLATLGGWTGLTFWRGATWPIVVLVAGVLVIVGALWWLGRSHVTSTYRATHWTGGDTAVVLGVLVALTVLLVPLPLVEGASVGYTPFPRLSWPAFEPLIAIGLLGLAAPAVVLLRKRAP